MQKIALFVKATVKAVLVNDKKWTFRYYAAVFSALFESS